ncbi:MAG TPA: LamG-like jellyroll fold domain-containing protein [Verrucomicrobiae bacterium]|jgi:hypothetical protein|nr:LamG-like jellyroll fold domain-containing protein [Verrucomicrobiae bacterium]
MKSTKHLQLFALLLSGAFATLQCTAAPPVLQNRYGFTNDASDSISHQDGTLAVADFDAGIDGPPTCSDGMVTLDGIGQWVELPPNLMTNLNAVTFEMWVTPMSQQPAWERLWDFGNQYTNSDGTTGSSEEFYGTPVYGGGGVGAQMNGGAGNLILSDGPIDLGAESHVVWTSDGATKKARLYVDGALVASSDNFPNTPAGLGPLPFEWLGHSLFSPDPWFNGSFDEFRIWNGALNQLQVAASAQSGPDVIGTNYGTITSLTLNLVTNSMFNGARQQVIVLAAASGLTNSSIDIHDQVGVSYVSDTPSVVTVDSNGVVIAKTLGSATITASLGSLTSSKTLTVVPPVAVLAHRYSFTSDASDSVGGANGALQGNANITGGQVVLDGTTGTYVNLPGGLISGYQSTTIDFWATFGTQSIWSYTWAFGNTVNNAGVSFLHFSGHNGGNGYTLDRATGPQLNMPGALDLQTVHVTAVVDPTTGVQAVYTNGALVGFSTTAVSPLNLVATNVSYIGRSLWNADPAPIFNMNEFRIYNGALTPAQIAVANQSGPDNTNIDPGAIQSLTLSLPATMTLESEIVGSFFVNYANLTHYNIAANSPLPLNVFTSSDSNVVAQAADGMLHAYGTGTATISVNYQGHVGSQSIKVVRPPRAVLDHEYSFTADASDSINHADGTLFGNAVISGGEVDLDGNATAGTYVGLPGGILNNYQATTIEFWADMGNTGGWTYAWAFGNTVNGAGANFFHFIAETGFGTHQIAIGTSAGAVSFNMPGILANKRVHMTVVNDPVNGVVACYTNGLLDGVSYNTFVPLNTLATNFSYIGHSLWTADGYTVMNMDEFRIYNGRLFSDEIAADDLLGPSQHLGSVTQVTLGAQVSGGNLVLSWPVTSAYTKVVSSPTLGAGASWGPVDGALTISGANYQVTTPITSGSRFFGLQP